MFPGDPGLTWPAVKKGEKSPKKATLDLFESISRIKSIVVIPLTPPLPRPPFALPPPRLTISGMFLSIDGGDGTGKSTQIELFCRWLEGLGQEVVTCRDPGSTALGEAVRELLLHRHDLDIHRRSEMLLYMAARAQMVEEVIRPALAEGKTVVADRFLLANVVYQGYGGGLDVETLWRVGQVATDGLMPELTIVLDLPAELAAARLSGQPDRMEQQGDAFHARVREGFLAEAARRPEQIAIIDASPCIEEVQRKMQEAARRVIELK